MSRESIRRLFKPLLVGSTKNLSPEGMLLLGMAVLVDEKPQEVIVEKMAKDVKDFHEKFGIEYEGPIRLLPDDLRTFRVARTYEEAKEYQDALTLHDALDANLDLIYICLGNLHCHGFSPEIISKAWNRVHNANMAKQLAKKAEDSKHGFSKDIIKPEGWKAPRFEDLIAGCEEK